MYFSKEKFRLDEEWRTIARTPQHVPKIVLGTLLSRTLDIKIVCLVLIFNLVLVRSTGFFFMTSLCERFDSVNFSKKIDSRD